MSKYYYVYILTNKSYTLYTGITNNLVKRVWEHKNKFVKGFAGKYNIDKLIYYEEFSDINQVLVREKQIKGESRQKKLDLIKTVNPNYNDLYEDVIR